MPLPGAPLKNIEKTELGKNTEQINTDTENLIDAFNNQKAAIEFRYLIRQQIF